MHWRAVSRQQTLVLGHSLGFADPETRLAYCELYLMTAAMALRVLPRAKLFETTVEDISYDHDLIVLQTKKGSISVRITIS